MAAASAPTRGARWSQNTFCEQSHGLVNTMSGCDLYLASRCSGTTTLALNFLHSAEKCAESCADEGRGTRHTAVASPHVRAGCSGTCIVTQCMFLSGLRSLRCYRCGHKCPSRLDTALNVPTGPRQLGPAVSITRRVLACTQVLSRCDRPFEVQLVGGRLWHRAGPGDCGQATVGQASVGQATVGLATMSRATVGPATMGGPGGRGPGDRWPGDRWPGDRGPGDCGSSDRGSSDLRPWAWRP